MSRPNNNNQLLAIGLATAAVASLAYYYVYSQQQKEKQVPTKPEPAVYPKKLDVDEDMDRKVTPATTEQKSKSTAGEDDERTLHARIEELDKEGKVLFKAKKVSLLELVLIHFMLSTLTLLAH